jgi:hypothetical protein
MTRAKLMTMCLVAVLACGAAAAQGRMSMDKLTPGDVYCSGMVTREAVPYDTYLISGEQSYYQTVFAQGDYVFINKGSSSGVKVGDQFDVMRPDDKPKGLKWYEYQTNQYRAMGRQWLDLGRVVVEHVQANVSVAKVAFSCDYMQRGDYVRPHVERMVPDLKPFDGNRFPGASGKSQAQVVTAKNFTLITGANDVIYINMGSSQGAKAGDYVRIFRYQGTRHETAYQLFWTQYRMWGFGRTPVAYHWNDLPRELLGEGVILRVSENAATVMITYSLKDIYLGDYVEIQ